MNAYLGLALGMAAAGLGGELFVRGSVGLARWLRVAPGVIGATVAAFATSSPELSVAIVSALAGEPQIALGNAMGSNLANLALILAVALVIAAMRCPPRTISQDYPVAAIIPPLTALLMADGQISRPDGLLLLAVFAGWLLVAVRDAWRLRSAAAEVLGEYRGGLVVVCCLAGLALLVAAGRLIVGSARTIAVEFGVDEFVVGATVVAIGTTIPEMATAIIAKLRGHDEVGLGTVLGSNIFNGGFIVAVAALIHPIAVPRHEVWLAAGFGVMALLLAYPGRGGMIGRWRGVVLLGLFGIYLAAITNRA